MSSSDKRREMLLQWKMERQKEKTLQQKKNEAAMGKTPGKKDTGGGTRSQRNFNWTAASAFKSCELPSTCRMNLSDKGCDDYPSEKSPNTCIDPAPDTTDPIPASDAPNTDLSAMREMMSELLDQKLSPIRSHLRGLHSKVVSLQNMIHHLQVMHIQMRHRNSTTANPQHTTTQPIRPRRQTGTRSVRSCRSIPDTCRRSTAPSLPEEDTSEVGGPLPTEVGHDESLPFGGTSAPCAIGKGYGDPLRSDPAGGGVVELCPPQAQGTDQGNGRNEDKENHLSPKTMNYLRQVELWCDGLGATPQMPEVKLRCFGGPSCSPRPRSSPPPHSDPGGGSPGGGGGLCPLGTPKIDDSCKKPKMCTLTPVGMISGGCLFDSASKFSTSRRLLDEADDLDDTLLT